VTRRQQCLDLARSGPRGPGPVDIGERLEEHADVIDIDLLDVEGEEFHLYLHVLPGEPAGSLMALAQKYALMIDTPLEFTPDGSLRLTAAGPQELVRQAALEMPDSVDARLEGDRARELLAEAGHPGGGFDITLVPAIRNAPAEVPVCEAIAQMWGDIGMDVRIQKILYQTYRPQTVSRTYQGAACFGGRTRQAPVQGFTLIQSQGASSFGVEHPWLDEKTAQAQSTIDPEARAQIEGGRGRFHVDSDFGRLAIYTWDTVWRVEPGVEEWSEQVRNFDVRAMSGYECIQHEE
jgi:hypothetical protein